METQPHEARPEQVNPWRRAVAGETCNFPMEGRRQCGQPGWMVNTQEGRVLCCEHDTDEAGNPANHAASDGKSVAGDELLRL